MEPHGLERVGEGDTTALTLRRSLGVPGATMMGLGSIIGTGVFVSIGIAAGVAGPSVIFAIALAALVAACSALSSAQLAATYPVSGGTYEYAYGLLHPAAGFTAGWMFLCAKCASAATAALGFAGYVLHTFGWGGAVPLALLAVAAVVVLTAIVLGGIRSSSAANIVIASVTLAALLTFVFAGLPTALGSWSLNLTPFFGTESDARSPLPGLLEATALMFVAYAGYARIATLGEEVKEPRRVIPRAIIATLIVSGLLYMSVGAVAVGSVGAEALSEATKSQAAPLAFVSRRFAIAAVPSLVAFGAVTAMLGVLLNLILGLSRVLLAMGRRGDMPRAVARLNRARTTPYVAVLVVAVLVALLAATGNVKTTWSFSAFTVLIYYGLTNLSALRLRPEERLFSPAYAWAGLASCLFFTFWIEWRIWVAGIVLIGLGLVWHLTAQRLSRRGDQGT
jgi:APA family basic amino acid/polyamine antiporter